MFLLRQSMKWILNQLCSTALLPCSQLKNQDFLHCLPEAISWRKPNQLNVQSCHPGEHSTQQLGEETQKCHMNGGVKRKGRGNPISKHLPFPPGSNLETGPAAVFYWQELVQHLCDLTEQSHQPAPPAPSVPRGQSTAAEFPDEPWTRNWLYRTKLSCGQHTQSSYWTACPAACMQAQLIVKSPFAPPSLKYCYGSFSGVFRSTCWNANMQIWFSPTL